MIIYNVTVNIDNAVAVEWLHWMQEVHIPAVMATGMFLENHIYRVLADEDSGGTTYAIQYYCEDMVTYENYRNVFAPALQSEVTRRYTDKFLAFRTLLEVVK